ncbi:ABC transporter ATP-binding protein [Aquisalinus flavus]|uniref:ABC transporter n=1 Tax=Aquisalinus flavus TaxID=1526572 RepID=A0A8J2V4N7_9PROT|nr:ABC transporter ATP-binding protein [Aquisalinus flavus]MBD0426063.1 ABC transporter ATP-binding protein [Aquisalinus flavus]UNE48351.1 ABC transporter ATP-binding protein [Aquisalinus flavus]GGD10996.1 ABC transporter [Aquisalinus flavus]
MAELVASNLSVAAGGRTILAEASVTLRQGELVALLGPNGAGKTTLARAMLGVETQTGSSRLDGMAITSLSPIDRARMIAYLPQIRPLAWPATVRDVVALGRYAHGAAIGRLTGRDAEAVDGALSACDLQPLANRSTDTLSGGELARVHLARAFAAGTPLMIADEPVAALDPRHQFQTMSLLRRYVDDGSGALVILHDIALAARFADRLVWMKDGRILADGPVSETLTEARLEEVYGIHARIIESADGPAIIVRSPVAQDRP